MVPSFTPPPLSDNDTSSSFLDGLKTLNNTFTTGTFVVGDGNKTGEGLKLKDYIFIFGSTLLGVVIARAVT